MSMGVSFPGLLVEVVQGVGWGLRRYNCNCVQDFLREADIWGFRFKSCLRNKLG